MFNPLLDFLAMRQDIVSRSRLLDLWGFLLNVPPLVIGVFFWERPVALAMIAAIVVSLVIASQIHKRRPFTRLMAICHVVVLPVLPLLALELRQVELLTPYGLWAAYTLTLFSVCVLIDVFDLYRYFVQGNRGYVGG